MEPLIFFKDWLNRNSHVYKLRILLCAGDVTKLPFRDNVFDVVTSFGVIEHFRSTSEVIAALSEARRVLKLGGYLILVVPNFAATFRNKLVIALTRSRFGMYHKTYTRSTLTKLLEKVEGLEIVESGFLPFGFRSLIVDMTRRYAIDKVIYLFYHAIWHILNSILKVISDDYQNPIYVIARKTR